MPENRASVRTHDHNLNAAFGFLTVVEDEQLGLFGGYLVLNTNGRPLEFHCTAPVKPNRAQEILYGPTLGDYLYGEQIGRTLLSRSQIEPRAVCTDREPALAVREHVDIPVVLVLPNECSPPSGVDDASPASTARQAWRLDDAHRDLRGAHVLRLGQSRVALCTHDAARREQTVQRLGDVPDSFDLNEPFERIREAIEEARRKGQ